MSDSSRVAHWDALAEAAFPLIEPIARRAPIGQLVKSLISARTRDAVSLAAYHALGDRFGSAAGIAVAGPAEVERVIAAVTFADVKAERLIAALREIASERPDFRLDFLADLPMADALAWLERLPGVGRKTAASVLNFSTLDRPIMVVDGHVVRALARLGINARTAPAMSERLTVAMPAWSAGRFRALHIRLKRLGQTICRWDVPNCARCPLSTACATATRSRARQYPLFVQPSSRVA